MSGHELDERVINFLQDVTGAMGLSLDVATEETADHVRLNLTGDRADIFLRKRGEALDALQVIVNTAFRREDRGERHYVVDALGRRFFCVFGPGALHSLYDVAESDASFGLATYRLISAKAPEDEPARAACRVLAFAGRRLS